MYQRQKKLLWSSLKSGVIITSAIVIVLLAIFFSGNISSLFSPKVQFRASVENVAGMRPGAPVWLYGIEIGRVDQIKLKESGTDVYISIDHNISALIRADAFVIVKTMGMLGDKYLEIMPGSPDAPPADRTTALKGVSALSMEELMDGAMESLINLQNISAKFDSIIGDFQKSEGSLNKLIHEPDLYSNLKKSSEELAAFTHSIRHSTGSLKMFIEDPQLYHDLQSSTEKLSKILQSVEQGDGIAGALINEKELADDLRKLLTELTTTAQNYGSTAQYLDSLIRDIKDNPDDYFNFSIF
ncbi:MlaD family protein [Chitinispirillales bacterium ANBcel5]|uniref:MlaD family protein n=1 Tax=Cellulosispirillum alkaliphilum TaxID=3039283 RepID=UPI002A4F5F6B|nr:MlaD family protein [Chitinispirillales bacterium ANBcel5]